MTDVVSDDGGGGVGGGSDGDGVGTYAGAVAQVANRGRRLNSCRST